MPDGLDGAEPGPAYGAQVPGAGEQVVLPDEVVKPERDPNEYKAIREPLKERGLCGDCAHWWHHERPAIREHLQFEYGRCHAHAPSPMFLALHAADDERFSLLWPMTMAHEGCGEYEPL